MEADRMHDIGQWLPTILILAALIMVPFSWYWHKLLDTDVKAGRVKLSWFGPTNLDTYRALKRHAMQGNKFAKWSLILARVWIVVVSLVVLAAFSSPIWIKHI